MYRITRCSGERNVVTITPVDPSNRHLALSFEQIGEIDATIAGAFPTAVVRTQWKGTAVRIAPATYDFTIYRFATDAAGQDVYTAVASGTFEQTDCDTVEAVNDFEVRLPDGQSALC